MRLVLAHEAPITGDVRGQDGREASRGFCPSRRGRRMMKRAAHPVESVLPPVPVRQWVLTLPYRLRYPMLVPCVSRLFGGGGNNSPGTLIHPDTDNRNIKEKNHSSHQKVQPISRKLQMLLIALETAEAVDAILLQ